VMQIGERRVVGRIEPREEAQAIYEAAAASGQQASLVSQERPNIFTSAVANIGPGEAIVVEIGYQDAVAVDDGRYSLRFPMVVAPRYVPGAGGIGMVGAAPRSDPMSDLSRVADAGRIDGPVRDPADTPPGVDHNPLTLAVTLDPGFPLGALTSLYHPVAVSAGEGGIRRITLADGSVPADRDFVLEWAPAADAAPSAAVFAEQRSDADGRTDTH